MQREADIFSFARCGSPCGYSAGIKLHLGIGELYTYNNIKIKKRFYQKI